MRESVPFPGRHPQELLGTTTRAQSGRTSNCYVRSSTRPLTMLPPPFNSTPNMSPGPPCVGSTESGQQSPRAPPVQNPPSILIPSHGVSHSPLLSALAATPSAPPGKTAPRSQSSLPAVPDHFTYLRRVPCSTAQSSMPPAMTTPSGPSPPHASSRINPCA